MTGTAQWLLIVGAAAVVLYGILVGGVACAGRRGAARALAGF
ncbi:MAG: hypothetical protein QOC64_1353, partial [Solirubrobacteraceae bacterium]|nr:hypothetical protein [Solirubrobacteraceae bacterium]